MHTHFLLEKSTQMDIWTREVTRTMKMGAHLFQLQRNINPTKNIESIVKFVTENSPQVQLFIENFHSRVKRANKKKQSDFGFLFDFVDFLTDTNDFLLFDKNIIFQIENLLLDWFRGFTFSENCDESLNIFLKLFYTAELGEEISELTDAWKGSKYYSEGETSPSSFGEKLDFTYFRILRYTLMKKLHQNAFILPSYMALGQYNINILIDIFDNFQISYSGPYKSMNICGVQEPKILFFISSAGKFDSMYNNGSQLYGIYSFPTKALALESDIVLNIISRCPVLPDWIQFLPPMRCESQQWTKSTYV